MAILDDLAQGMNWLHKNKLMHRDIKADNAI